MVLATGSNRAMGLEAGCESNAVGHLVLAGCCDFRKRELIDW